MGFRLFAATSLVALASLMAGGAQAAVVLISFSTPADGVVVSGASQPSTGMEAGPGSLSFALTGIVNIMGAHPDEAAPAVALSSAPIVEMASNHGGGDHAAAKPAPGGDGDPASGSAPAAKLVTLSSIATAVTDGGGDAHMPAALGPATSGSQTTFVAFTPALAPTDWQDMDNQGFDSHNIASALADQVIAAVPEPSSWALMLVGFGGMGALLRRRRLLAA